MLPLDTAITFFAASVLLALSPGPDNVFVLLHSAVHGRKAGLLVVLGLCSGLLFHTAAVALGLAAVVLTIAVTVGGALLVERARNVRFCEWSGQSPDGRKHGDDLGVEAMPFEGAADSRIPLADGIINDKVALSVQAFFRSQVQAVPIETSDGPRAAATIGAARDRATAAVIALAAGASAARGTVGRAAARSAVAWRRSSIFVSTAAAAARRCDPIESGIPARTGGKAAAISCTATSNRHGITRRAERRRTGSHATSTATSPTATTATRYDQISRVTSTDTNQTARGRKRMDGIATRSGN